MAHKVYIVDDDSAVRTALTLLLRSVGLDVDSVVSARAFLDAYQPPPPGVRCCLVTDVRMPGMSGLELQDELIRYHADIAVIVLSGHADVPMAVRAMSAGAVSILEKPVNEQQLIDLIHTSVNGKRTSAAQSTHASLAAKRAMLSSRQGEVFDLLMQGLQTKEVAARLNLSPRTVEVHRSKILERLQAPSFAQLIKELLQSAGPQG